MVSAKTIAVVVCVFLTIQLAASRAPHLRNCKNPCNTRFGQKVCCDSIHRNEPPRCPKTPRVLMDCEDKDIMVKPVKFQSCRTDDDCNNDELCCSDVCHSGPPKICIQSDINDHFFLH
ncbi:uncharacterized protein LOC135219648 [Macrobrachium nipponense]|uniref:uncharacterized protein LOC135219648 n=1 Tax=Macrobrachium nipponense TaxID=159736 RepID=UPI0030C8B2ED